jgi:uncharacterized protein
MNDLISEDQLIEKILKSSKIIAMVGVSAIKKEISTNIKRRPSTIVMKYLQEFGYRVIPVNPSAVGQKIYGETVVANLEDIKESIDIVDIFRPSEEAPLFAKQTINIKAKTFWLQYGIENETSKKLVKENNINYVANKCIKQEYQRLFLKVNPVFPALKNK